MTVVESARETSAGGDQRKGLRGGRALRWMLLTAPAAFYVAFIARSSFTFEGRTYFPLFDDAMISMRYGRNLAEGHGLVWNPGQRVEGYSNFLWTLGMAGAHMLGLPDSRTSLVVMAAGALLLLALVVVVGRICTQLEPGRRIPRLAAMVLVAFFYPLVFWSLRGMEVGFAALLVALAVMLSLELVGRWEGRRRWALAMTLAAAALTRDDLLLPAVLIVAFTIWRLPRAHRREAALLLGGTLVGAVAAHLAFRVAYYGSALPNTYYLKLEGIGLGTRLRRGITGVGYTWLTELYAPLVLAAAYVAATRRRISPGVLLLVVLFLAQCAYSVYVGGDAFEDLRWANRYVTTAVPLLLVLAALGVGALLREAAARWRLVLTVAAGLCLAGALQVKDWLPTHLIGVPESAGVNVLRPALAVTCALAIVVAAAYCRRRGDRSRGPLRQASMGFAAAAVVLAMLAGANFQAVRDWVRLGAVDVPYEATGARTGLTIRELTPPDTTVAMTAAGNLAYFDRRPAIDLLGKMDEHVAKTPPKPVPFRPGHDKWDYAYSIGHLRPAVITQLWFPTRRDLCDLRAWGYRKIGPQLFVQPGAAGPNQAELGRRITAQDFLHGLPDPGRCS